MTWQLCVVLPLICMVAGIVGMFVWMHRTVA